MIPPPHLEPATPLALEVLARLPLAEAFYRLWRFLADDTVLQSVFDQHHGRSYQQDLSFADIVRVTADAITRSHGRGRPAITRAIEQQLLDAKERAVYGKLSRIPLPLSEALLARLTNRLHAAIPTHVRHTLLPASLTGLEVVIIDGKKIKRVAKRLLELRGRPGKVFGGKLLVAYQPARGVAVALVADPDGEANDIRLVPQLLPAVRACVGGPRLWVADRQFCDLDQPGRLTAEGDHYLIRFALKTSFHPDPERPRVRGADGQGRTFHEEWGWMGVPTQGDRRRYVRRIWLERPGEEAVVLVSDLLDADRYPAVDLLSTYLSRWQIETVFQKITEVFALEHLIGCSPQATVFQASLCLVMYNVLEVLRCQVAASRPKPLEPEQLSLGKIFGDVREELVGLHRVLSVGEVVGCLKESGTVEELLERLRVCVVAAWSPDWLKAVPTKPRIYKPKTPNKKSGAHTSVHRVLQQARLRNTPKKPSPSSQ
jgi:hypothetical protein